MQASAILESLFRWTHVVAGILWIGLLYFFNWVNTAFAPTMDGETKKKVVPELLPRTLYWFRWGAAWTWVTGVVLLALIFYHGGTLLDDPASGWQVGAYVMVAVAFLGVVVYDILMKTLGKSNMMAAVVVGLILTAAAVYLMKSWAGFSYRGYVIHTGAMFGTIMAFNVWFRIWPAQQKIIRAIKNGEAPDASLVGLAGTRSRHNTYMSLPLVWMMVNTHTVWAAGTWGWLYTVGAVVIGWWIGSMLFRKAPKVQGF